MESCGVAYWRGNWNSYTQLKCCQRVLLGTAQGVLKDDQVKYLYYALRKADKNEASNPKLGK